MEELMYGVLEFKDENYPFLFENRVIRIIGAPFQFHGEFEDNASFSVLHGVTTDNRDVYFLDCTVRASFPFLQISVFPVGYVISSGNVGEPCDGTFDQALFYSNAINSFFPPQKAMTLDVDHKTRGPMKLTLDFSKEDEVSFTYGNATCLFSIYREVNVRQGKSDLGQLTSFFAFDFAERQSYDVLPKLWLELYDFLSFINYSRSITFNKIVLKRKKADGKLTINAYAHIFSKEKEYDLPQPYKAITIDDIPKEKIAIIFETIAAIRAHDRRIQYYYPEKYNDDNRIDSQRWLMIALAFDGLFQERYPGYKQKEKKSFAVAKSTALNALQQVDISGLTKKEKAYFKDCCQQIELYEGVLAAKFNYITNKYKNVLSCIAQDNLKRFNTKLSDCGEIYAQYRNKIAHGSVESLTEKELAVYRLLRAMIYLLLLENCELDSNTLTVIVKKLFLND